MNIQLYSTLTPSQKEQLFQLWNNEYPSLLHLENLEAFEAAMQKIKPQQYLLTLANNDNIIGWLALFERENAPWFLMMVSQKEQGKGMGSALLKEAKKLRDELHGWAIPPSMNYSKANGQPYLSPLAFYEKNGFDIFHHIKGDGKPIETVRIQWKRI